MKTSVILLAGGLGMRMQSNIPKQFLQLKNKPIVLYSFEVFVTLPYVEEIIVVCEEKYQPLFKNDSKKIKFASPGLRRQDSVYNGFKKIKEDATLVCVHDSARPFIKSGMIDDLIESASQHGAAVIGVPIKFTVKESNSDQLVTKTLDRSALWEIQTPQAMRPDLLKKGFKIALEKQITVTDDVSLVELTKHPVKIVRGCYTNLKITTKEDLSFAEHLLGS